MSYNPTPFPPDFPDDDEEFMDDGEIDEPEDDDDDEFDDEVEYDYGMDDDG